MSWWDDQNDQLGDGPADTLKAAWRTLLARRAQSGRPLPSTADALESFAAAARGAALEPAFQSLVVWRARDPVATYAGTGGVADLIEVFADAIRRVSQDYQVRFERPPRPSELVKTLDFILSPQPDAYLSDARPADWEQLRLRAEEAPEAPK